MTLLSELNTLRESDPMNLFAEVSKVTEAYCIEHNIPCRRQYTHDELADAFEEVRAAAVEILLLAPAPAEACTDLGENLTGDALARAEQARREDRP